MTDIEKKETEETNRKKRTLDRQEVIEENGVKRVKVEPNSLLGLENTNKNQNSNSLDQKMRSDDESENNKGQSEDKDDPEELQKLKNEYILLKEQYFSEKIEEINREIKKIEDGEHEDLNEKLSKLKAKKDKSILLAEQMHKHKQDSIIYALAADIQFATDEYDAESNDLKEKILKALTKKRKKLEEDKRDLSLNDIVAEPQRFSTRTLRKRNKEAGNNLSSDSIKIKVPEIRTKLNDDEISQDLAAISKKVINL